VLAADGGGNDSDGLTQLDDRPLHDPLRRRAAPGGQCRGTDGS